MFLINIKKFTEASKHNHTTMSLMWRLDMLNIDETATLFVLKTSHNIFIIQDHSQFQTLRGPPAEVYLVNKMNFDKTTYIVTCFSDFFS